MQSQNEAINKKIEAKAQTGITQLQWLVYIFANKHTDRNDDYYDHHCMSYILVTVPDGLKSTAASLQLNLQITNSLSETIKLYWVNYDGNAVLYGNVTSGNEISQGTYGTHPWLITTTSDELIAYFVPLLSDMEITVE